MLAKPTIVRLQGNIKMKPDNAVDYEISDSDSLNAALTNVLASARENDVTVVGGWSCRNDDGKSDFEVVISELS